MAGANANDLPGMPDLANFGADFNEADRPAIRDLATIGVVTARAVHRSSQVITAAFDGFNPGDIADATNRTPNYIATVLRNLAADDGENPNAIPALDAAARVGRTLKEALTVRPVRFKEITIPPFSSQEPEDWLKWSEYVLRPIINQNGWDDDRAKAILPSLIGKGNFFNNVCGIKHFPIDAQGNPIPKTLDQVLQEYDRAILPPAASAIAIAQAQKVKQKEGESIASYVARFMAVFRRAFPLADEEDDYTRNNMLNTLMNGLYHSAIRARCFAREPPLDTIQMFSEYAMAQQAAITRNAMAEGKSERGLFAMDNAKGKGRGKGASSTAPEGAVTDRRLLFCNHCKLRGHLEAGCFKKPGNEHLKEAFLKRRNSFEGGKGGPAKKRKMGALDKPERKEEEDRYPGNQ